MDQVILARWYNKIKRIGDCWIWTGARTTSGYGVMKNINKTNTVAHRLSYEHFIQAIPSTLDLDHLCRNRLCVNPIHLEPVTRKQNLNRGLNGILKTHCINGHEWIAENLYTEKGGKHKCKECVRLRGIKTRAVN